MARGIGVILTGTGSDGALGLKEIKEKGAVTRRMPEYAGYTVLEAADGHQALACEAVLMSGYSEAEVRQDMQESVPILPKPFTSDALRRYVATALADG